jgi:hypothetical protein
MMKAVSKSASKEPSERASMTPMKPLGDLAGLLDDVRARCPAFAEAFGAHLLRLIEQHKDIRGMAAETVMIDATQLKTHRTAASLCEKGLFPATRYDHCARTLMSAICVASTVIFHLLVMNKDE